MILIYKVRYIPSHRRNYLSSSIQDYDDNLGKLVHSSQHESTRERSIALASIWQSIMPPNGSLLTFFTSLSWTSLPFDAIAKSTWCGDDPDI